MILTNLGLGNYVKESRERLLTAARSVNIDLIEPIQETTIELGRKRRRKEQFLGSKNVAWQFIQQTNKVRNKDRWQWLRNGPPKRETESLICAPQEQAILTNIIKEKIDKSQEQAKCCSRADETINHIVSECPKLAQ